MSPRRVVMAATSLAYARLARGACRPMANHAPCPSAPRPWPSCVSGMFQLDRFVQARQRAPVSAPAMSASPIAAKAVTGLAWPSVEPSRNLHERARQREAHSRPPRIRHAAIGLVRSGDRPCRTKAKTRESPSPAPATEPSGLSPLGPRPQSRQRPAHDHLTRRAVCAPPIASKAVSGSPSPSPSQVRREARPWPSCPRPRDRAYGSPLTSAWPLLAGLRRAAGGHLGRAGMKQKRTREPSKASSECAAPHIHEIDCVNVSRSPAEPVEARGMGFHVSGGKQQGAARHGMYHPRKPRNCCTCK